MCGERYQLLSSLTLQPFDRPWKEFQAIFQRDALLLSSELFHFVQEGIEVRTTANLTTPETANTPNTPSIPNATRTPELRF